MSTLPEDPAKVAGRKKHLLIASRDLPLNTGGIASYQRQLGEEMAKSGDVSVGFLAAEAGPGAIGRSIHLPGPSTVLDVLQDRKAWMRLASRLVLHPLLQKWIAARFRRAFNAVAIPPTDVVHFVGTGWDFAGFGFHHFARMQGARFTVWPAVHPGEWGDDRIDLRLYFLADAVFCQSHFEANHLRKLGLEREKIVHCGLPPMCLPGRDGMAFREQHGIGERPAVLFLGRRDEGKGYPALIGAWRHVLLQHPDACLILSGPGGSEYETQRDSLPAGSVLDLGVADEEVKAGALAACDIFCLPSAHESFGIVFAEAWSYGKPVICGPAPASREWVRDGGTGLHTDQNPDSIAGAIHRLLFDKSLSASMGDAGRKFQRSELTWESIAKIHREAFRFGT
ncbi:MAG: glycosyltransferase family 4 protein [Verrucomicrobia bacterium]|nr:glycosyltransferase family 4 protein [Verrucomicrobiota bacterium]